MMSIYFPPIMEFKDLGLKKEICFYDSKMKGKISWLLSFFFPYKWLNLAFFIIEKREKVIQQIRLQKIEAIAILECKKNNDSY